MKACLILSLLIPFKSCFIHIHESFMLGYNKNVSWRNEKGFYSLDSKMCKNRYNDFVFAVKLAI